MDNHSKTKFINKKYRRIVCAQWMGRLVPTVLEHKGVGAHFFIKLGGMGPLCK